MKHISASLICVIASRSCQLIRNETPHFKFSFIFFWSCIQFFFKTSIPPFKKRIAFLILDLKLISSLAICFQRAEWEAAVSVPLNKPCSSPKFGVVNPVKFARDSSVKKNSTAYGR